ncbi:predicted protein [Postia placenta Mad-698-R]|nr:predicted protein [Postia placenta Mad-698-R]
MPCFFMKVTSRRFAPILDKGDEKLSRSASFIGRTSAWIEAIKAEALSALHGSDTCLGNHMYTIEGVVQSTKLGGWGTLLFIGGLSQMVFSLSHGETQGDARPSEARLSGLLLEKGKADTVCPLEKSRVINRGGKGALFRDAD